MTEKPDNQLTHIQAAYQGVGPKPRMLIVMGPGLRLNGMVLHQADTFEKLGIEPVFMVYTARSKAAIPQRDNVLTADTLNEIKAYAMDPENHIGMVLADDVAGQESLGVPLTRILKNPIAVDLRDLEKGYHPTFAGPVAVQFSTNLSKEQRVDLRNEVRLYGGLNAYQENFGMHGPYRPLVDAYKGAIRERN